LSVSKTFLFNISPNIVFEGDLLVAMWSWINAWGPGSIRESLFHWQGPKKNSSVTYLIYTWEKAHRFFSHQFLCNPNVYIFREKKQNFHSIFRIQLLKNKPTFFFVLQDFWCLCLLNQLLTFSLLFYFLYPEHALFYNNFDKC
jgi:hypothetical protein